MMEIIAIDFDGTLCVDKFPEIGEPNWEVINRAKAVQEAGIPTILNTCREGKLLDNAVKACARWGLKFDAVNENLPAFVAETGDNPRKIAATQYWDDKAVCMGTGPDPIPTPTPTRNNIVEKSGDVLKSGADVICHQVNCKGVMGTGLALQVKKQNPKLFQEYRLVCARHGVDNRPFYGIDTQTIVSDFLHARNEIWGNLSEYARRFAHLTTNLTNEQLSAKFASKDEYGRIVDRFKTYNVIPLPGKSRR